MNLYQEELMDHYRNPRNRGEVDQPDFTSGQVNPSCGDSVMMTGCITNGVVQSCFFTGSGCVISQATASMLTQACMGKTVAEVADLDTAFILNLTGLELGPTRLKCALLALQALQEGVKVYVESHQTHS